MTDTHTTTTKTKMEAQREAVEARKEILRLLMKIEELENEADDLLVALMKAKADKRKADKEVVELSTEEERERYKEEALDERVNALFEDLVEGWEQREADTAEAEEFEAELFLENPRRPSWKAMLEGQFRSPTTLTDDEAEALTYRLREDRP